MVQWWACQCASGLLMISHFWRLRQVNCPHGPSDGVLRITLPIVLQSRNVGRTYDLARGNDRRNGYV